MHIIPVYTLEDLPESDRYILPNWKPNANNQRAAVWAYFQRDDGGAEAYLEGIKFVFSRVPDHRSWIQTYSGLAFDLKTINPDHILIEDIAHALSGINRFGAHTVGRYSVAQHSLFASYRVPQDLELPALLHDAHETYINDMTTPVKRMCSGYSELADRIDRAIERKFQLPVGIFEHPLIKDADFRLCVTEARDLFQHDQTHLWKLAMEYKPYDEKIEVVEAGHVERTFLTRFKQLLEIHAQTQPSS